MTIFTEAVPIIQAILTNGATIANVTAAVHVGLVAVLLIVIAGGRRAAFAQVTFDDVEVVVINEPVGIDIRVISW